MELPLGALLTAAFVITAVVVVIAVCVQLSRKKEEIPPVVYEVVGPPQLPQGPDSITTDVNVAYAGTIQTHPIAAYASTIHEVDPIPLLPSRVRCFKTVIAALTM